MLSILQPSNLVEVIERRVMASGQPVQAYWYSISGPREEYAESIQAVQRQIPIVPLIPRRPGMFEAPNALVSDLVQLMDEERNAFHPFLVEGRWEADKPLVLLILSRSPLGVPGGCSPTPFPSWLPRFGGTIVNLDIWDLTFSAEAPLNCPEAAVPSLCEALFTIEKALVSRLKNSLLKDATSSQDFFSSIVSDQKRTSSDLMARWEQNLLAVKEPSGFRPSVKDGNSVVARLVAHFVKTTPDQLSKSGEIIGKAFSCDSATSSSLVSVLFRPTQRVQNNYAAFGRNLIITVYAVYQYVTAASHADGYPHYPVTLINSMSLHLSEEMGLLAENLSVEVEQ